MSERKNEIGLDAAPAFEYDNRSDRSDNLPHTMGALGQLSIEEWQWEQDCSRLGRDEATRLYTKGLAVTAEQLQRRPDEDTATLRSNVATSLLRGESLDPLFPGHTITPGGEEFLAGCLREELRLAEQVQTYRTLAEWKPGLLIDALTRDLPAKLRERFEDAVMSLDDYTRSQFLRYCAGECPKWLNGKEYGVRSNALARNREQMLACQEDLRQMRIDIRPPLKYVQLYPDRNRSSIFQDLQAYIGIINKEAERLACRTSSTEFGQITQSLSNVTARAVSLVLTAYNSPAVTVTSPKEFRYQAYEAVKAYEKQSEELFALHRLRDHKRTRSMESPEVLSLIDRVMKRSAKCAGLTLEEEKAHALEVEQGAWAEIRFAYAHPEDHMLTDEMKTALDVYDKSVGLLDLDDDQLLACMENGMKSLEKLLQHNRGTVFLTMRKRAMERKTEQNLVEWLHLGYRAFVRAVYKYDPTKDFKLNTYFKSWSRAYANEAVAKEMGITVAQWNDVGAVLKKSADLLQTKRREPTDEEIRESLEWGVKRFEKAKHTMAAKRAGSTLKLTEPMMAVEDFADDLVESLDAIDSNHSSDVESQISSPVAFNEESLQEYSEMLGGDSVAIDIIRLHFERKYEPFTIASILDLTEAEVADRLNKALATIGECLRSETDDIM